MDRELDVQGEVMLAKAMNQMALYSEGSYDYLGIGVDIKTGEEFEVLRDKVTSEVSYTDLQEVEEMTDFEKALMSRDGVDEEEAKAERRRAREELYDMLENGDGYDDVEDMMMCEYGLEMDYILDLIQEQLLCWCNLKIEMVKRDMVVS